MITGVGRGKDKLILIIDHNVNGKGPAGWWTAVPTVGVYPIPLLAARTVMKLSSGDLLGSTRSLLSR